jgi:hypothetical protein
MPYVKFTENDLQRANSVNLVQFLQSRGENLKRVGNEHKLIYSDNNGVHDSIMIKGNKWFDHRNGVGGGAIKFVQNYYEMSFQNAVTELCDGHIDGIEISNQSHRNIVPANANIESERKEFVSGGSFCLPAANKDMKRAFAYLVKGRCISPEIVSFFAKEKKIYEDAEHHNVVFVGHDENGVPKQATKRSTLSFGEPFKQTVAGSDTHCSFSHFGGSEKLFVFESPIDMMSFISLNNRNGEWQKHNFICLNGVYKNALVRALDTHENLRSVTFCLDNDDAGQTAVRKLAEWVEKAGITNRYSIVPQNKDFNEDLLAKNGIDISPKQEMEMSMA